MTEDKEWSLKGKGIWKDILFKMEEQWYSASDIETLRKKLIKDIDSIVKYWKERDDDMSKYYIDAFLSFKHNINKRFGVE
jgi:hypothetical protein